ncbi:hypothetical protein EWM64_g4991 [Hericium alpestre]|uniref:Uncharacterized protein n=1 Tax=Hericium alpestre TaxID=135208 RepID=A0A4Y9ZZR3_9AGAM|nr:hypothetical protein EWM64_g4991 [Hericium alpestre]
MPSEPAPTMQKRGPRRPKGSKNKASTGTVGHPPKGGSAPRKNQQSTSSDVAAEPAVQSSTPVVPVLKLKDSCAREAPESQDRSQGVDNAIDANAQALVIQNSGGSTPHPDRTAEPALVASHGTSTETNLDAPITQNVPSENHVANLGGHFTTATASQGHDTTAAPVLQAAVTAESMPSGTSAASSPVIELAPAMRAKCLDAAQQAPDKQSSKKPDNAPDAPQACPEYVPGPSDLAGADEIDIDYLLGETGEDANEEDEF